MTVDLKTLTGLVPVKTGAAVRLRGLDPVFVEKMIVTLLMMPPDLRAELRIGSAKRTRFEQWVGWLRYRLGGPLAARQPDQSGAAPAHGR